MSADGPRRLLLALDIDCTHFSPDKSWFISEEYWKKKYAELDELAKRDNVELLFSVVTSKDSFDPLCCRMANLLSDYLVRGNDQMFVSGNKGSDDTFCLVRLVNKERYNELQYELVDETVTHRWSPPHSPKLTSHFVIVYGYMNKAEAISEIAQHHGLSLSQCILLDDTAEVLATAQKAGIQTVSFNELSIHNCNNILRDEAKIEAYIEQQMQSLREKVKTFDWDSAPRTFTPGYRRERDSLPVRMLESCGEWLSDAVANLCLGCRATKW